MYTSTGITTAHATLPYVLVQARMHHRWVAIHCWMFGAWWSCNLCMGMDRYKAGSICSNDTIYPTTSFYPLPWMHCMSAFSLVLKATTNNICLHLLHSTIASLDPTRLYYTLPWLHFALLEFTRQYHGFTCRWLYVTLPWSYLTLRDSTFALLGSTNHILDCLSCISVIKECYQISFLKAHWEAFSLVSSSLFSEDLFAYNPGISTMQNHATKELSRGKYHKNNKPHQKCWFIGFLERRH